MITEVTAPSRLEIPVGPTPAAASRRGEDFDRLRYATVETLHLSPLPCWRDLPEKEWRRRALAMVQEIEEQSAARRSRTRRKPLGASRVNILTTARPARSDLPLPSYMR